MSKPGVRFVFWAAFTASIIILPFLLIVGLHFADRILFGGKRTLGGHVGIMLLPIIIVSMLLATTICRWLGISADGKTTEVLQRSSHQPSPDVEAMELRISRTVWSSLALLMDVFALMVMMAVYFLPSVPGTERTGYGIAAFFGLFSLGPWYGWLTRNGLVARMDADGIRAENAGPKSFVPWEQIAACEVFRVQDVLGEDAFTRYIFKNTDGKLLLTLGLLFTTKEDRAQFEHAVRAVFV
jgi:hypothetical protein